MMKSLSAKSATEQSKNDRKNRKRNSRERDNGQYDGCHVIEKIDNDSNGQNLENIDSFEENRSPHNAAVQKKARIIDGVKNDSTASESLPLGYFADGTQIYRNVIGDNELLKDGHLTIHNLPMTKDLNGELT